MKKKHSSHAITGDVSLVDTARAAEFFKADGVIVTGAYTGSAPQADEVENVRRAVTCNVLVGSGVNIENVDKFMPWADALVVGSSMKVDGQWQNAIDADKVARFIEQVRKCEHALAR